MAWNQVCPSPNHTSKGWMRFWAPRDAPFQLLTEHSKASLGGEFEMLSGKKVFARGGTFLVVSHGGRWVSVMWVHDVRLFGLGPSHQEARKPKEAALFANKIQCAGCIVRSGNGQLGKQAQFQHDSPDYEPVPVLAWPQPSPVI